MLRASGLITQSALPLSAILLSDTPRYFGALDAYRGGDPFVIIELIVEAALGAARLGTTAGAELAGIHTGWQGRISARAGTADSALATLLISHPVLDADTASQQLAISAQAARRAFSRLENAGIVVGYQVARRRRARRAPVVLELMDRTTSGMRRTGP